MSSMGEWTTATLDASSSRSTVRGTAPSDSPSWPPSAPSTAPLRPLTKRSEWSVRVPTTISSAAWSSPSPVVSPPSAPSCTAGWLTTTAIEKRFRSGRSLVVKNTGAAKTFCEAKTPLNARSTYALFATSPACTGSATSVMARFDMCSPPRSVSTGPMATPPDATDSTPATSRAAQSSDRTVGSSHAVLMRHSSPTSTTEVRTTCTDSCGANTRCSHRTVWSNASSVRYGKSLL
eukprot:3825889-Pleurochrysis_carterae.AAC.1